MPRLVPTLASHFPEGRQHKLFWIVLLVGAKYHQQKSYFGMNRWKMLMESRTSWKPFKARYSFPHKLWFPPNTNGNWHKIFSWIKPRSWCSNSPLSWLTLGSLLFSLNQTKICPSLLSYRDQMTEQRKHKQRMGKRVFCQGYIWSWLCFNFRSPQQCPKSSEHWRETLKWWDFSGTGWFSCRTIC